MTPLAQSELDKGLGARPPSPFLPPFPLRGNLLGLGVLVGFHSVEGGKKEVEGEGEGKRGRAPLP